MPHVRSYAETRACANCGTMFKRRADAAKVGRGLHCSRRCSMAVRYGPMTVDSAAVRTMYCEQDMTLKEIGLVAGVGWKRVQRMVLALNVPIRNGRRRNPLRRSAVRYRRTANAKTGQDVHHLNCIETDDRPDNLVAVSRQRHSDLHKQLEQISAKLFQAGLISFSPLTGYAITLPLSKLMEG